MSRWPHPVIVGGLGALAVHGLGALGVVQVLDPATVQTIAATIQRMEGYYPGSLAYQNNNPGNLIYIGQASAVPGAGGFARFPSYSAGLQALNDQIQLYAARGMSIQEMMDVYAPAVAGNDPVSYASQIAGALGVSPSTNLLDVTFGSGSSPAALPVPAFDLAGLFSAADANTLMFAGLGLAVLAIAIGRN